MFAHLALSHKKSFDTTSFVSSIPGYDGCPPDPSVQVIYFLIF